MKFANHSCAGLFCLFSVMLASSLPAQETRVAPDNSDRRVSSPVDTDAGASVAVTPGCSGTRFNLEPRADPLPQNSESVDLLLNRVSSGVDLVVGAANDQRSSIGGFDAYYVHRGGTNCAVDFEGSFPPVLLIPR